MTVLAQGSYYLLLKMAFECAPLLDGNSANAMESWGDGSRCLKLKGQMRYMPEWESIIFLGTPV